MAHLAEHAAVRAGNALNGQHRPVGVVAHIHGGHAVQVNILGGNLAVVDQLLQQAVIADKAAFAVADGDQVFIIHIAFAQPGALVGSYAGAHQHALVAVDGVKG